MNSEPKVEAQIRSQPAAVAGGAVIGTLGGLIGLGGTFVGGLLLGAIPSAVLLPVLAAILLISAAKIWRHA